MTAAVPTAGSQTSSSAKSKSLSSFLRLQQNQISSARMARPAIPPTTPPAIAPTGVEDEPPLELLLASEAELVADDDPGTVVNSVMVDLEVVVMLVLEELELEGGGVFSAECQPQSIRR